MFLEYYSMMMHSKFHSILPNNGQENGTETCLLAKKNAQWRKRIKFCFICINNASITQNAFSVYKWIILETCHICMESLTISLHGNVNKSKFIKNNFP